MRQKKSEKPKEQEHSKQERAELTEFDDLLDKLLPLGRKLLSEVIEEKQKHLANIQDEKYAIEFEKAKNSCWKEYANILFAQYQRLSADYANFQKRGPRQIADSVAYEKEKVIKSILPVLDNFEHTLQNADSAEDKQVVIDGVRIIYTQMLDVLKSHDVEQIKAAGEQFDPSVHQAMMQQEDSEKQQGIILEEFQKGYTLNGRVIRPAKVIVNKVQEAGEAEKENGGQNEEVKG